MKKNDIKTLAVITGLLIVIAAVISFITFSNNNAKILDRALTTANKDKINKIEITKKDNTINLTKSNTWKVADFNADQTLIQNNLDLLTKSKVKNIASTNKDNYKTFGVTDDAAKINIFESDKQVSSFYVGKATTTNGTYIRFDGDTNVYSIDQNIIALIEKSINEMRDKTIVSLNTDNVESIHTSNIDLQRDSNNWYLVETGSINKNKNLDQTKVTDFIKNITNLVGTSLETETTKDQLTSPELEVKIGIKGQDSVTYTIFKIGDKNLVTKSGDSLIYSIAGYQLELLNRKESDLLAIQSN